MNGFDEFVKLFGDITILNVIELILAAFFLYLIYKKVKDHLIKVHESEKKRDEQLKEALDAVRKYPEYRQQSIEIQKKLESDIKGLRESQEGLRETQKQTAERLADMEEITQRREKNKLRDCLLQNYRYYTNPNTNPSGTWTRVESETFWALFQDYEDAGGNGYMHEEVAPAMKMLVIVDSSKRTT